MKSLNVTIQMKAATEQYFPVVLLIVQYKVILTFECVENILACDHSDKRPTHHKYCETAVMYTGGFSMKSLVREWLGWLR